MLSLRVGGRWLVGVRLTQDVTPTDRWPRGCYETSWKMQTEFGWRSEFLVAGALVEVYDGAFRLWMGTLNQPNWSTGEFTARGLSEQASTFPAFDSGYSTTTVPLTAAQTAITEYGWPVAADASVPSSALVTGDATDGINMLDVVLDASADEQGKRWAVNADGLLYFAADSSTVDWQIVPGAVELGQTNTNYRSDIFVRYVRDSDSALVTARAEWSDGGATRDRYGFVAENVPAVDLGPISPTRAATIANGILSKCAPRPGWTGGTDLQHGEILTPGGEPAPLSLIRAGQVVRLLGVYDDMTYTGVAPYLDVVLGEVRWVDGSTTITLSPVDARGDDLSSVIEDVARGAA